jgi:8-oxo-dGTP pyrophosphatase MutT (NUDIX family)
MTGSVPDTSSIDKALRPLLLTPEAAEQLTTHGRTRAAVLVPLFQHGDDLHAVFTRRREDLRRHAGEISFPGGRQDPDDDHLLTTALREADEEIGLPPSEVEVVGALPPISTFVTDYAVYPFVGVISPGRAWRLSEREVAEVLELPLPAVRDAHKRQRLWRRGVPFATDTYPVGNAFIWGATARIVAELLERLKPVI